MRDFLLASCPVMLWVIALVHLVFIGTIFPSWRRKKNMLLLLSGLIAFGLFYDALILSLGGVMAEGAVLKALSRVRFISHGALIPLIFPICAYALDLKKSWRKIVWALTAVIIVLGIAEGFAVQLEAQHAAGIVRYASGGGTPAWAKAVSGLLSYGTVIPLILAGIVVWVRQKTPALLLSGALMFAFSALGPATGNFDLIFYISMYGEVLMILFFCIYANRKPALQNR